MMKLKKFKQLDDSEPTRRRTPLQTDIENTLKRLYTTSVCQPVSTEYGKVLYKAAYNKSTITKESMETFSALFLREAEPTLYGL